MKWLERIPVLTLIKTLGVLIVAMVAATTLAIQLRIQVMETTATEQSANVDLALALQNLRYYTTQVQQFLTDASLTGEADSYREAERYHGLANAVIARIAKTSSIRTDQATELTGLIDDQMATGHRMYQAYAAGDRTTGNRLMGTFDRLSDQIATVVGKWVEHAGNRLTTAAARADTARQAMAYEQHSLSLALLLLVGVALLAIYGKIHRGLHRLHDGLVNLNRGNKDLTRRIHIPGRGILTDIAEEFNRFLATLDNQTTTMRSVSREANQRLTRLQSGFDRTRAGVGEVLDNTNQLAVAIKQMAATVEEVARNTSEARNTANEATGETARGLEVVEESIGLIRGMDGTIAAAVEAIDRLAEDSSRIRNIVDVIREISDQTNLLALNAAIEAARAGESGRGFAVVAEEVRSLASRTQESTEEIQEMIDRLQAGTESSVTKMSETAKASNEAVACAARAGEMLQAIYGHIQALNDMNTGVATAAEEQATVAAEINRNAVAVAGICRDVAAEAERDREEMLVTEFTVREIDMLMSQYRVSHLDDGDGELQDDILHWNDGFLVGIPSIDRQHRRLFELMNQVYHQFRDREPDATVKITIDELVQFARQHLSDEEALMERAGYSDLEGHRITHQRLLAELGERVQAYQESSSREALIELLWFLKNWLVDHIFRVDKAYSEELIAAGIR